MLSLAALCLLPSLALAQDYPSRPVKIIVGLAAGGVSDVVTRLYADTVTKATGHQFVIENRPQGSGSAAASAIQTADPDGYTLYVLAAAQHATIPAMGSAPYDPIEGHQPVTVLFSIPTLMTVPADSPAKDLKGLVVLAKSKPGGLSIGSPGLGTPSHLSGAKLVSVLGASAQFVHYRGAAPMLNDLLPGRLDAAVLSTLTGKPHLVDNKIIALSSDGMQRWPAMPSVPVLRELGLENATIATWFGLVAPPKTPPAIVQKIQQAFVAASRDKALNARLEDNGLATLTSSPSEMRAMMVKANSEIRELVVALGLNKQ